MWQRWQAISLWKRVLVGLFLGMALGLILRHTLGSSIEEASFTISGDAGSVDAISINEKIESMLQRGITLDTDTPPAAGSGSISSSPFMYTPNAGWSGSDTIKLSTVVPYGRAKSLVTTWIYPFGEAFFRLIKMLIIPLIATTLVVGVTAMGDPKKLGSLGLRTISLYLLTTLFAVSLGLAMGTIVRPGVGVNYETASDADIEDVKSKVQKGKEAGSMTDRLLDIIPTNPVAGLSSGNVLQTIFFAIMVGVGILFVGPPADPVKRFFDAAAEVVMKITVLVMELAPYGVFALMAWVMAEKGIEVLTNMGKLAIALYVACFLQIVLVYGGVVVRGILKLPMKPFFRGVADAQGIAFSTASSSATLPVTISCAEKNLGVEKSVAGSVLPLGATINMDGTAIYLGLVALFAAQAGGMTLDFSQYLMVAMTATLVSIGAAGIPSAGLLLSATVLGVIGIGEEQALLVIAFIFPFDRLLDMMRTVTNITGDLAVSCTVAKWENALDEDVFRSSDKTS